VDADTVHPLLRLGVDTHMAPSLIGTGRAWLRRLHKLTEAATVTRHLRYYSVAVRGSATGVAIHLFNLAREMSTVVAGTGGGGLATRERGALTSP